MTKMRAQVRIGQKSRETFAEGCNICRRDQKATLVVDIFGQSSGIGCEQGRRAYAVGELAEHEGLTGFA